MTESVCKKCGRKAGEPCLPFEGHVFISELADREVKLDAIAKALDFPEGAWRIAGCDVMAHSISDIIRNSTATMEREIAALARISALTKALRKAGAELEAFRGDADEPMVVNTARKIIRDILSAASRK